MKNRNIAETALQNADNTSDRNRLDTSRLIETPEGVELELRVAGLTARAYAWLLDAMIRAAIYFAGFWLTLMLAPALGSGAVGLMLILMFLTEWFYPVLFEVYTGTTPGKKRFRLFVCHDDGTPISWQSSLIRNFLRVVDVLPVGYGFAIVAMLCSRDFKRLGDMAAGTVVVYRDDTALDYRVPRMEPLPLPSPLHQEEQRAILAFAERSQQLSDARCDELAQLLSPYIGGQYVAEKETVIACANSIAYGAGRARDGVQQEGGA